MTIGTQKPITRENVGTVMHQYVADLRNASKNSHHYEVQHVGGKGFVNHYYDKDNQPLFTLQYQSGEPSCYVYKMTNEAKEHVTFVDLDADGNMDSVGVFYPNGKHFVARDLNDDGKYTKNQILDSEM